MVALTWDLGVDVPNAFLCYLNSIEERFEFTMEFETGCELPFLDVLVNRNPDKVHSLKNVQSPNKKFQSPQFKKKIQIPQFKTFFKVHNF